VIFSGEGNFARPAGQSNPGTAVGRIGRSRRALRVHRGGHRIPEAANRPAAGRSSRETDHVIGHELVHAFQHDIVGQGSSPGLAQMRFPLWFIEGMVGISLPRARRPADGDVASPIGARRRPPDARDHRRAPVFPLPLRSGLLGLRGRSLRRHRDRKDSEGGAQRRRRRGDGEPNSRHRLEEVERGLASVNPRYLRVAPRFARTGGRLRRGASERREERWKTQRRAFDLSPWEAGRLPVDARSVLHRPVSRRYRVRDGRAQDRRDRGRPALREPPVRPFVGKLEPRREEVRLLGGERGPAGPLLPRHRPRREDPGDLLPEAGRSTPSGRRRGTRSCS
jgi:hypothetical protein